MFSMNETLHIPIDPRALAVLRAIEAEGESAWFVGGCVRDAAIGRRAHDFDIATSARPDRIAALFSSKGCRIVEAGAAHGSVGVVADGLLVEVTTYRVEAAYSDRRRPDAVVFVDDIALDLARRDFCMNAMAYHPERGMFDPFDGMGDIAERRIRAVGVAASRFAEDPLRIMRALRFSAQLGFSFDKETEKSLAEQAFALRGVAKERVFSELSKTLCAPDAATVLVRYACALETVLEGLEALAAQPSACTKRRETALEHAARALSHTPAVAALRFAMLFSCMAPHADGCGRNGERAAQTARERLRALKAPRKLTERVCALVARGGGPYAADRFSVRLLVAANGGDVGFVRDLLALGIASAAASGKDGREGELRRASETLDRLERSGAPMHRSRLALSGRDLIAAGTVPGPAIAAKLDALLLEVMRETVENDRTALLDLASRLEPAAEDEAGDIFRKILEMRLTERAEHSNIQTRA